MAATVLADNLISNIPIVFENAENAVVPAPTGGVAPTVSLDDVSAGAVAIGADGASVDFTPAVPPPTDGTAVTIAALFTRADGTVITVSGAFDVGPAPDLTAVSGSFNLTGITTRPLTPPA